MEEELRWEELSERISLLILEDEQEGVGRVPTRQESCARGTGVFIPQSGLPRWGRQYGRQRRRAGKQKAAAAARPPPGGGGGNKRLESDASWRKQ